MIERCIFHLLSSPWLRVKVSSDAKEITIEGRVLPKAIPVPEDTCIDASAGNDTSAFSSYVAHWKKNMHLHRHTWKIVGGKVLGTSFLSSAAFWAILLLGINMQGLLSIRTVLSAYSVRILWSALQRKPLSLSLSLSPVSYLTATPSPIYFPFAVAERLVDVDMPWEDSTACEVVVLWLQADTTCAASSKVLSVFSKVHLEG